MRETIEQFRAAIPKAGLHPPEVIEPDGKSTDDAGWYVFHDGSIPVWSLQRIGVARDPVLEHTPQHTR